MEPTDLPDDARKTLVRKRKKKRGLARLDRLGWPHWVVIGVLLVVALGVGYLVSAPSDTGGGVRQFESHH